MAHPSDSAVQQAAEALIRDQAAAELGMELASARVHIGDGVAVQVDGVAADEAVLLEAFAHQGPLRGGQKHKVAADALKLITLGRGRPTAMLVLAFADEQAASYARGTGWLAQALAAWNVRVMVVELDAEQREAIRAAQATQNMRNAVSEMATTSPRMAPQTIEIDAPGYVPFEPRTREQRALRAALRRELCRPGRDSACHVLRPAACPHRRRERAAIQP